MTIFQRNSNRLINTLLAAVTGIYLLLATTAFAANYVVIANKDVPSDSMPRAEIRSIFLGDKVKWENRKYIKISVPESGVVLNEFLQGIGLTNSQFDNQWMKLVFTGKASMPQSFTEMAKIVEYVASHAGAIGVVAAGQGNGSVKTISIK